MPDRSWKAYERRRPRRWASAIPFAHRFWLKVWPRGDCWEWRGATDATTGYGSYQFLAVDDGPVYAHRTAFELAKGTIPAGLVIDHLCRHPWCVKPSHLEAVTRGANVLRGIGPSAVHARKTHCDRGHEFTPETTYVTKTGARQCVACRRLRDAG